MNNKANTLKRCGFRAAMVNILKRGSFHREGGTSNAAPRSRHQKKALCFQTEHPVPPTHGGDGNTSSLLGFWRRPLQGAQRRLQERRVITSCLESIHSDALHTFLCYC